MSNVELNLVDRGAGEPAIVFIHGFTCNLSNWKEQLSSLSGDHRLVAIDLPGHGDSPEPQEASIEVLAEAANSTLGALEFEKVVLVGHSMGCRVVSEMFKQSPTRVCGVVHVDGSRVATGDAEDAVRRTNETLDRIGMDRFVKDLYTGFFVASTPASVRNFVNAGLPAIDLEFARRLWPNVVRWDASRSQTVLATIDVPLLLIQSTYLDTDLKRVSLALDQSTPWVDQIKSLAKDVAVTVIPGVGHFPMLEAPQQTNEAISSFVRRLAGSASAG